MVDNITEYSLKENKVKKHSMRVSILILILYAILIFVNVVQSTSFSTYYVSISRYLHYSAYALMLVIGILYLFCFTKSVRQLFVAAFFALIVFVTGIKSGFHTDFNIMLVLAFVLFGSQLTFKQLAFTQSVAMFTALVSISIFSLFGFLPTTGTSSKVYLFQSSYQEIVYFLGFNHPNAYGTILTMALISFFFGIKNRNLKLFIFLSACVAIIDIKIGANTAAIGASIFFISLISIPLMDKFQRTLNIITKYLMIIIPIFSIWIGYNPYTLIAQLINRYISSRPNIWSYYLNLNKISLFAIPPDLDLSVGSKSIIGNGVLDGTYVYILVYWGLVPLIIFILSLWVLNNLDTGDSRLNWVKSFIVLAIVFMSFPESHMTFFFENVFILSIGMLQIKRTNRGRLFT